MEEGGVDAEELVEVCGKGAREIQREAEAGGEGDREEFVEGLDGGVEDGGDQGGEGHLEEGFFRGAGFKGVVGVGVEGVDFDGGRAGRVEGPVEAGEVFGAVWGWLVLVWRWFGEEGLHVPVCGEEEKVHG